MALPVTIPNEFASATASIPLSQLDTNFTTLADAVNGISDGSETLANASVTVLTAGTANVTTLNTSGQVVFNDAGADVDFRVEGDTDANLLFVDASTDRVGVKTNAPSSDLHINPATEDIFTNGLRVQRADTPTQNVVFNYSGGSANIVATDAALSSPAIRFLTSTDGTTSTERVRIDSSGNVLINTTVNGGNSKLKSKVAAGTFGFEVTDEAQSDFIVAPLSGAVCRVGPSAGAMAFYSASSERVRIDSSGNLLVGTTSQINAGRLCIDFNQSTHQAIAMRNNNAANSGNYVVFMNSADGQAGVISQTGATTVNYGTSSDYRLKENVVPMTGALEKVLELNPVTYTWKEDGSAGQGFIAHELQAVCPDAVVGEKDATEIRQVQVSSAVPATYDEEGNELTPAVEAVHEEREVPVIQSVDTSFLVATLTAAIQELSAKNDALEARIAALEGQ
jgi:hypothetical protein